MYVVYCQNKPRSEYIVAEYETYFEVSTAHFTLLLLTAVSPDQGDCSVTRGLCLKQTPEDFDTARAADVVPTEKVLLFNGFQILILWISNKYLIQH